jgi:putative transposase
MSKAFSSKLGNKDDVVIETKHTMLVTNKSVVPHKFHSILDALLSKCQKNVKLMLADRSKNSSKYYDDIPCVVSKSLITKYQKNKKCRAVKACVIPICGDKGKQVKLESNNKLRIPSITKKETIDITPLKPIVGHIRSVEFFKRNSDWFVSYTYETPITPIETTGFVGVDRNARDNVATLSDIDSGKVIRIGPDVKLWKDNLKKRKAKLQRKGAKCLLKKINRKQSNRTKDINHKVSKQIVDYAVNHRKSIVLEDLGKIKNSKKCGRYVQKSNWAFFQLETFIKYKASLYGIPVIYVNPAFTSKTCSRCGSINDVNGKKFVCSCGHKDHRDANASFNIGIRGKQSCDGITDNVRELSAGLIDDSQTSKGEVSVC